jgi:hypothetical protein
LISNIVFGYIIQNSNIGKREGITLLIIYLIFLIISYAPS